MKYIAIVAVALVSLNSCVTKKKYVALQGDLSKSKAAHDADLAKLNTCQDQTIRMQADLTAANATIVGREDRIKSLEEQLNDCKAVRDKQLTQVGDLTVLSSKANDNMKETLAQLQEKDKYITLLQNAKNKADSLNLALSVNLKGVLKEGLDDTDVEVKVDKTVVMVNLSDKMLFKSGSADLTSKASDVLAKIAKIIESRPDLEVMVEGYTDNDPIKNACIKDNWDLSTKRSTAVIRVLQGTYKINPNRLIAAGRGEYNALVANDTPANKAINRRTRIIIMPKLDQFYDLLDPNKVPE